MANNVLTPVIPKILAQGLMALRQNCITPKLVANMSSDVAGTKGSTLDVPLPSAITAVDVTPAATAPVSGAVAPTSVAVALTKWKEASFDLSDLELEQAMNGIVPMQVSEAVKSICNAVDNSLLALYPAFYGYHGTAGTTPFANQDTGVTDATAVRKILNRQLAPMDNRSAILDPEAEANALALKYFAESTFTGDTNPMRNGEIGRRVGIDWFMNQNVPLHTAGTGASATTNTAGYAAGVKTVTLASAGTGTILVGDIITFAGHTQTYTITAGDADVSNGGTISFEPGLAVALAASAIAITLKASHRVNLVFHRDAIAFASRPLLPIPGGMGSMVATDPISGLSLRAEVTREYKRSRWSFDFLWGCAVARPELGARLAG